VEIYVGPELGYKFYESDGRNLTANLNKFTAGMATGFALHLGENTKVDLRYSTDFTKVYDIEEENLKYQSFAFTVQQTLFRRLK
jgi:glutamate synthase domain-containing protein 3